LLDQRLAQLIVDLAQAAHAQARPELVEHPHIGEARPMRQSRKGTPGALFGQQRQDLVERVSRREHRQQMSSPELGSAEIRTWSSGRTHIPMFVDKVVGNEGGYQSQQLGRPGHRKLRFHGQGAYPF
jgi:hypothetical protein